MPEILPIEDFNTNVLGREDEAYEYALKLQEYGLINEDLSDI